MYLIYYINKNDVIIYWAGHSSHPCGDFTEYRLGAARMTTTERARKKVKIINSAQRDIGLPEIFFRLENAQITNINVLNHVEELKCI